MRRVKPLPTDIQIHATALIEQDVEIGSGTAVWDNVHVRAGARIGKHCIIGEKTYIAGDVVLGDQVKVNAFVYLCAGVSIERGVMVSAGTVFTNDRRPRATTADLGELLSSEADSQTGRTLVREGATIGANATIGVDLVIGRFAMVGMGSVVTRSVEDFHLVVGSPARRIAFVCRCGQRLPEAVEPGSTDGRLRCRECAREYLVREENVMEVA